VKWYEVLGWAWIIVGAAATGVCLIRLAVSPAGPLARNGETRSDLRFRAAVSLMLMSSGLLLVTYVWWSRLIELVVLCIYGPMMWNRYFRRQRTSGRRGRPDGADAGTDKG
jgi:hypothetical protein